MDDGFDYPRVGRCVAGSESPRGSSRSTPSPQGAARNDDAARDGQVVGESRDRVEASIDGCAGETAEPGLLRPQAQADRLRRRNGETGFEAANLAGRRSAG